MTSKFAQVRKKWLRASTATAAATALVVGGGLAAAPAGYAAGEHDGHGGGDACEFFLEHMWANEDGIPALGSFAHINEYHTDPAYENLVLSLASGAIGNSEMPIIDIYGGPLGWIPVFNPSHVKGHNTDYVTLLTSCGGIGIPLDSNDLTTLNVPSAEELADLSDLIIPGLPSPEMITDPEYLWKTTDASAILQRVTPETLTNMEEYKNFAGDHFDTWRLLWETALEDVSNGNPTGILEILKITDNINTLESLSSVVGDDTTDGLLGGDLVGGLLGGDALGGLLGGGSTDDLLSLDAVTQLLGEEGLSELLNADQLSGLLSLINQIESPDASAQSEFTVLLEGAADASGKGQCQGTLSENTFSISCLYAGMVSAVTSASIDTGDGELELAVIGDTSGGAAGSYELTAEQVAALKSGKFMVNVHTTSSSSAAISGAVKPC
ncbi:hypothetical protein GCM10027417_06240 [Glutamicibacter endophyticus]